MLQNTRVDTLADLVRTQNKEIERSGLVTAFPHHWQVPAATEKAAYDSVLAQSAQLNFEYFGFAWATIIDGLRGRSSKAWDILSALRQAVDEAPVSDQRRVTVAQHIHAMEFVDLYKSAGVTDLFWSHATHNMEQPDGLRVHPFPLFPAQAPIAEMSGTSARSRRYLANFIGAYNPGLYLTNVRKVIFDDADRFPDLLIVKRDAWHFDRTVYEGQIKGLSASKQQIELEVQRMAEYLDAIHQSWFTLCPTGSGPNSIRIFECLSLGSIPIVLSKDLHLPGSQALWEKAAIIDDDSEQGYRRAIDRARQMSIADRLKMLVEGRRIFEIVRPDRYVELITKGMKAIENDK